eukprot:CAMPEP_0184288884 /NCGR_PEP_ID=MMETSP1049-20130417/1389_1 /TAXON_ID=77928 /ORGANISM="Proteomonas sulcata, Strain CCMP704" /LENGTH=48 /DNA_ID= /DNA_START= /DNA_END= /DNA_ORIENTATION=
MLLNAKSLALSSDFGFPTPPKNAVNVSSISPISSEMHPPKHKPSSDHE